MNQLYPEHKSMQFHPSAIFVVASMTLLLSLLIPCPPLVLDVIWIFVLFIAASVAWVCMKARHSTDLAGLAPLVFSLTLMRLALQVMTAGKIIKQQPIGPLLERIESALSTSGILAALLICLLLAAIAVIVIFASCQRISIASNNYLKKILPLKQIGVETDLRLGSINETEAKTLWNRITWESRFFSAMNGAGLLMRSEAAICIFTLITCLIFPMISAPSQNAPQTELLSRIAPPVIALSLLSLIPALAVSISCGTLMSRDTLTLRTQDSKEVLLPSKKISIINETDGQEDEIELVNPEFLNHKDVDERIVTFEPTQKPLLTGKDKESEDLQKSDIVQSPFVESVQITAKNANDYYQELSSLVDTAEHKQAVILLTSVQTYSLPVTVPVNIAIRMAQKKQKVLLIDADLEQNAIARVFEVSPGQIYNKIRRTCFENLSVCGIPVKTIDSLTRNNEILNRFDKILIYAPNAKEIRLDCPPENDVNVYYFTDKDDAALKTLASDSFNQCASIRLVPEIRTILKS